MGVNGMAGSRATGCNSVSSWSVPGASRHKSGGKCPKNCRICDHPMCGRPASLLTFSCIWDLMVWSGEVRIQITAEGHTLKVRLADRSSCCSNAGRPIGHRSNDLAGVQSGWHSQSLSTAFEFQRCSTRHWCVSVSRRPGMHFGSGGHHGLDYRQNPRHPPVRYRPAPQTSRCFPERKTVHRICHKPVAMIEARQRFLRLRRTRVLRQVVLGVCCPCV